MINMIKKLRFLLVALGITSAMNLGAQQTVSTPAADLFDIQFGPDGNATDISANDVKVLHGTRVPKTFFNEASNSYVPYFCGNTQCFYRINYNDNENIKNALKNGFSLETYYMPSTSGNVCPLSAQQNGGCGIEQASSGEILFYCYVGGGYKTVKSGVKARPHQFYHVVAIYDKEAQKVRLFVDGKKAGELDAKGDFGFPDSESAHWFGIGGDAYISNYAQYSLEGYVPIARMYSHIITADEADALYNEAKKVSSVASKPVADIFNVEFGENGTASDVSGRNVSVKAGKNTPKTAINGDYKRMQATFAGNNQSFYRIDYADDEVMQKAFSNGFSLEVLYKSNNTNDVCPLSAQESGGCGIEQEKNGNIQFYCRMGSSYQTITSDVKVEVGKYYHVVAVYDKDLTQTRIYVNGVLAGTKEAEGSYSFPPQKEAWWMVIGGDAHTSENAQYNLNGDVVFARMYGKALNFDEADLLYEEATSAAKATAIAVATDEGYGTYYSNRNFILPQGLTAFGYTAANGDGSLTKTEDYTAGDVIPANTAVVVKGDKGEYDYCVTDRAATMAITGNLLKGVTETTLINATNGVKRYILTRADNGVLAFYRTTTGNINVKANRAYLEIPEALGVAAFSLEGPATGINNVEAVKTKAQGIYTLGGIRLSTNTTQGLPAGAYIVNGRVVIVK